MRVGATTKAKCLGEESGWKYKELKGGQEIYVWNKLRRKKAWNQTRRKKHEMDYMGTSNPWKESGIYSEDKRKS